MRNYWNIIFASLCGVFVSATLSGIPLIVYTYRPLYSYVALVCGILAGLICFYLLPARILPKENTDTAPQVATPLARDGILLFLTLTILCFALLHSSWFATYAISPWSAIPPLYVLTFFIVALIAYFSSYVCASRFYFLLIASLFLFLQHTYLPLVYPQGFGGDRLRHLAVERFLEQGNIYTPALFGVKVQYAHLGPIPIPEVFLVGNKTSYASQWGFTLLIHEITGISLITVDKWLVPIMWGLFMPFLIYAIARRLTKSELTARLAVVTTSLLYPLQVFGASTLPVSFSLPFFLGACYAWIAYLDSPTKKIRYALALAIMSASFYCSYILYLFLLGIVGVLVLTKKCTRSRIYVGLATLCSSVVLVLLEIIQDGSTLKSLGIYDVLIGFPSDILGRVTNIVRYFALPTNIDQGNFIFNQTGIPLVTLPILAWRLWPTVISIAIVLLVLFALKRLHRVAILLVALLCNYFVSWYFFQGTHILSRRIDEVVAIIIALCVAYSVARWYEHKGALSRPRVALLSSFLLAAATVMTYTSGPVLDQVTPDEFLQAKVVWAKEQKIGPPYCVIANTWPLLGLEYESATKIAGGGFPIYKEYAQPERVKLYEAMTQRPNAEYLRWAKQITGASKCFYAVDTRIINQEILDRTYQVLGPPRTIGGTLLWEY